MTAAAATADAETITYSTTATAAAELIFMPATYGAVRFILAAPFFVAVTRAVIVNFLTYVKALELTLKKL